MRLVLCTMAISVALAGCSSSSKDFGSALGDAFSGLNTGLASGAALEYSLYQDYRRKSETLEYISLGSYACGEPGTETERTIQKKTFVGIKKAQDDLVATFDKLSLLIAYGKSVADYRQGATTFAATADAIGKTSGSVAKFGGAEAQAVAGIVSGFVSLTKVAYTESEAAALREMARTAKPQLKIWIESLKKSFVRANKPLMKAYFLWNGCALERLRYLRDTYPTGPDQVDRRGHHRLEGVVQSTALQFDAAYAEYITEREKYLAGMPNYNDLLDAVYNANDKLLEVSNDDIAASISSIGAVADALKGARDAVDAI